MHKEVVQTLGSAKHKKKNNIQPKKAQWCLAIYEECSSGFKKVSKY